ncbi:MAG: response regulator [Chitinophagales bacterium]
MSFSLKNKILLIDDSSAEPILLENAIMQSGRNIILETFDNSFDAVDELKRRLKEEKESLPNLILLDLNMHGYSGLDVLRILKKENDLRYIPIIVMTSSDLDSDMVDCLEAGACSVLVKPTDNSRYVEVIQTINDYWFNTVKRLDSGFY